MTTQDKQTPSFTGLKLYGDKHVAFFRPIDWHQFDWVGEEAKEGVLFGPLLDDAATVFAVEVTDLGMEVSPDDADDLFEGFLSGIQQLPDCQIEFSEKWVAGALTGLEAKYTFIEDGNTRKRWIRVLYQDTRQLTVLAQGATVEKYDYWLPMLNQCMRTVKVLSGKDKPNMQALSASY